MIKATLLLHSVNPDGQAICTWLLKYPRFIHSELMTHRVFSRNAASSRAIPVRRTLAAIIKEPAVPEYWGANQKGMQAATTLTGFKCWLARRLWLTARWPAVAAAWLMNACGLHKQIANRVLEPWMHMTVLVTATEWANFYKLRAHPEAQPEFQVLAYRMLAAFRTSVPVSRSWGEWHIPFGDRMSNTLELEDKLKVATARAARTSYLTFDGEFSVDKDLLMHDRLTLSGHWSPTEHCAMAAPADPLLDQGNFRGWTPYRKRFSNENVRQVDYAAILASKPSWVTLDGA